MIQNWIKTITPKNEDDNPNPNPNLSSGDVVAWEGFISRRG